MIILLGISAVSTVIVAGGITYIVKNVNKRNSGAWKSEMTEEDLKMKYASGKLTKDQYENKRSEMTYYNQMRTPYGSVSLQRIL